MSIGDGFNIWMGKFLWDCVEVGAVILGGIIFIIIKSFLRYQRDLKKGIEDVEK